MSSTPSNLPWAYTAPQFVADLRHLFGSEASCGEARWTAAREYLWQKYPDDARNEEKLRALTWACNFLCGHLKELDVGCAAVVGRQKGLVSHHLALAMYRASVGTPPTLWERTTVADVLRMTEEQHELNGDG